MPDCVHFIFLSFFYLMISIFFLKHIIYCSKWLIERLFNVKWALLYSYIYDETTFTHDVSCNKHVAGSGCSVQDEWLFATNEMGYKTNGGWKVCLAACGSATYALSFACISRSWNSPNRRHSGPNMLLICPRWRCKKMYVSDCCLTPIQQYFGYTMARTS